MSLALKRAGQRIGHLIDALVRVMFWIACAAMAAMLAITLAEIILRYFFNSPTRWISDGVGYLLAWMIMLGLPEVTLRQQHVSISFLSDLVPAKRAYGRILALVGAAATLGSGYLSLVVAIQQHNRGVLTQGLWQIPKAWISGAIAVGFLGATAAFLVLALHPSETKPQE